MDIIQIVIALCIILLADMETAVNIDILCIIKDGCTQLRTRSEIEKTEETG